ncbi:hypothetical protein K470DRAFT_258813, partial [Piedraia hortae CBS 480.64]
MNFFNTFITPLALLATAAPGLCKGVIGKKGLVKIFAEDYKGGYVCLDKLQLAILELVAMPYFTGHIGEICVNKAEFTKLASVLNEADDANVWGVDEQRGPLAKYTNPLLIDDVYIPAPEETQEEPMLDHLNYSRAHLALLLRRSLQP